MTACTVHEMQSSNASTQPASALHPAILGSDHQPDTVWEARVLAEDWRKVYNTIRPHGSLKYLPPKPGAVELVAKNVEGFKPWSLSWTPA